MPVALWIPGSVLLYTPFPGWVYLVTLTSFPISLTVDALVTGLIVFRILRVYLEVVKPTGSGTGKSKLQPVIFMLIESGMALLCMQLADLVLFIIQTDSTLVVDQPIAYTLQMLSVTIKSVIITFFFQMLWAFTGNATYTNPSTCCNGYIFPQQKSMVEVTSSLRFNSDYPTSTMETVCRDDDIGIQDSVAEVQSRTEVQT